MSKHTPGPWEVCELGDYPGIDHNEGSILLFGYPDEDCGIRGKDEEQRLANARLIAAAPDLLEACEEMLEEIQVWEGEHGAHPAATKARDAIAKAKGQQ